jgi:hypothetical protein
LVRPLILNSCLSWTISSIWWNRVSIILCLIVKILLSIWCNCVYCRDTLIKITAIVHHLFLVRRLPYLILNILYSWLSRALCWLLVRVPSWRRSLLTLRIEIYWIIDILIHHVIVHHSTGIHIVLHNLLCRLSDVVVIVIVIMIFPIFWWFFLLLHFNYLLASTLIYIVTVYYYIATIFLRLLCYNLIVWTRTVLCK